MTDNLRFPSGTTVQQAKKDAKRASSRESIDLSTALNLQPKRHGLNLAWHKAIEWLKGPGKPVSTFRIPTEGKTHCLQLTLDKPLGFIMGQGGTGKSVAVVQMIESALQSGTQNISYFGLECDEPPSPLDVAMQRLLELKRSHPDTIETIGWPTLPGKNKLTDVALQPGTLVILDEFSFLTRGLSAADLLAWLAQYDAGAILVAQSARDFNIEGWMGSDDQDTISFTATGQLKQMDAFRPDLEPLVKLSQSLRLSEFLVTDYRGWHGIARFMAESD